MRTKFIDTPDTLNGNGDLDLNMDAGSIQMALMAQQIRDLADMQKTIMGMLSAAGGTATAPRRGRPPKMESGESSALNAESVTGGGDEYISMSEPYRVSVTIKGTAPLLMHRYDADSVEEKGKAAKGSRTKKTDDVVSYMYRTDEGLLGIDGVMFAAAIREAGRSVPDPRSPRKSMRDLLKSILIPVFECSPFLPHITEPHFYHRARVVVQRAAVTRVRPAIMKGWEIAFLLDIASGEYLPPHLLRKLIVDAGRYNGLADYRPTFGRFDMIHFDIVELD